MRLQSMIMAGLVSAVIICVAMAAKPIDLGADAVISRVATQAEDDADIAALSALTNALASATKVSDVKDAVSTWANASLQAKKDKKDKKAK